MHPSTPNIKSLIVTGLLLSAHWVSALQSFAQDGKGQGQGQVHASASDYPEIPPPPAAMLKGAVSKTGASKRLPRKEMSNDENAILFHQRGIIAFGQRKLDEAQENFEKVLELKPTDTATMDMLSDICTQKNDIQGAYTFSWLADRLNIALSLSLDPENERRRARIKQYENRMKASIAENGRWQIHDQRMVAPRSGKVHQLPSGPSIRDGRHAKRSTTISGSAQNQSK